MTYITPEAAREQDDALREAENRVEELEQELAAERNKYDALAHSYELCDAKLRRAQEALRDLAEAASHIPMYPSPVHHLATPGATRLLDVMLERQDAIREAQEATP